MKINKKKMLNKTHLEHSLIALIIQIVGSALVNPWWSGSVAVTVFLGREIAQHEYKGGGPNEVSPLYGVFNHWSTDSILDVLCPVVCCLSFAVVHHVYNNGVATFNVF